MLIVDKIHSLKKLLSLQNNYLLKDLSYHYQILTDLYEYVDNIYLTLLDSPDILNRINLLQSRLSIQYDIVGEDKLRKYGIKSIIIEFGYNGHERDESKPHSPLYEYYYGEEMVDYHISTIISSYEIYDYAYKNFGYMINSDIIIDSLGNRNYLYVSKENRTFFNLSDEEYGNISVYTDSSYDEMIEMGFRNIKTLYFNLIENYGFVNDNCVDLYYKINTENKEEIFCKILDMSNNYINDEEHIFMKDAILYITLNVKYFINIYGNLNKEIVYILDNRYNDYKLYDMNGNHLLQIMIHK